MGKHIRNGIDYTDPNVDKTLNNTSENPVQNKVITEALANKVNISDIGTAASKNVPTSGDASATQVVMGNDSRLAWMDTNGDIYFGDKRIIRVMDEDSYKDLVDSDETENIIYCTYPTPTDNRSLSVNPQNIENNTGDESEEENELNEPVEEESIEETPPDDDMR
jgi:hypothetical protein